MSKQPVQISKIPNLKLIYIQKLYRSKLLYFGLAGVSIFILGWLFFNFRIVRARVINTEKVTQQLDRQREINWDKPNQTPKVTSEYGAQSEKSLDWRCFSWNTFPVHNGWTRDSSDHDFYIDYYIPANQPAIICITPALAGALKAESNKGFLYEAYPVGSNPNDALRIRIIMGVSLAEKLCRKLGGNQNCANRVLERQAIVRHAPEKKN